MSRPAAKHQLHSRNWFGKASAGLVLGFTLALGLVGLLALVTPEGLIGGPDKAQFNMWLLSPIWCLTVSFVFFFRDGLRAWLWLGGANLLVFGLLQGGRLLSA